MITDCREVSTSDHIRSLYRFNREAQANQSDSLWKDTEVAAWSSMDLTHCTICTFDVSKALETRLCFYEWPQSLEIINLKFQCSGRTHLWPQIDDKMTTTGNEALKLRQCRFTGVPWPCRPDGVFLPGSFGTIFALSSKVADLQYPSTNYSRSAAPDCSSCLAICYNTSLVPAQQMSKRIQHDTSHQR